MTVSTGAPFTHLTELLQAEQAEQQTWATEIPSWHPRNEGEEETEETTEVEGTEDQAAGQTTEGQQTDTDLPFRIEDIDDEFVLTGPDARKWAIARQAEMQAAMTRRTQEAAALAEQLGERKELLDRLDSDDPTVSRQALGEFLAKHNLVLPDEDDGEEEVEEPEGDLDPRIVALQEEVAELRAERTAESDAEASAKQQEAFAGHIVSSLDKHAKDLGLENAEAIPEEDREAIVTRALAMPRRPDGLLDMDTAIAKELDYQQAIEKRAKERYLESKDVPGVRTGGGASSASKTVDLTDRSTRLSRAEAVAGRHY